MYRTTRNFGGGKFLRIAKFLVLASFNLANLWPCAIEDVHPQWHKMANFYLAILAKKSQKGKFLFWRMAI